MTQVSLLGASVFMAIPCVMVFVSITLKPRGNRRANIIIGAFYGVANLATFIHYGLLGLFHILRYYGNCAYRTHRLVCI